jgi:hypothetical protein
MVFESNDYGVRVTVTLSESKDYEYRALMFAESNTEVHARRTLALSTLWCYSVCVKYYSIYVLSTSSSAHKSYGVRE